MFREAARERLRGRGERRCGRGAEGPPRRGRSPGAPPEGFQGRGYRRVPPRFEGERVPLPRRAGCPVTATITAEDIRFARGIAHAYARKTGTRHLADEWEGAALLGLAQAVATFDATK